MRSPAVAIAWQLLARYRVWIAAGSAYFIFAAACCWLLPHSQVFMNVRHALMIPLMGIPLGLMAVFVFGSEIDVAGKESTFPSNMFTLPARTGKLVGWPMIYGTLTMATVCTAILWLVFWPSGIPFSPWWPPLLAATCLAWLQAIAWSPFPLPWVRIGLLILLIGLQVVLVQVCYIVGAGESLISLALAGQIPVAYWLTVKRVSCARCGDNADWQLPAASWLNFLNPTRDRQRPFESATQAQFWLEWRLNGLVFPIIVALATPILAALILIGRLNPSKSGDFLRSPLILLILPLALGLCANGHWGKFIAARKDREPSQFLSIRPISSAGIVGVKLRAAAASVLAGYIIAVVMTVLLVFLTGTFTEISLRWTAITRSTSALQEIVVACLAIILIAVCTWKFTAQMMFIVLSGREWLLIIFFAVIIPVFIVVLLVAQLVSVHREYQIMLRETLQYMLPYILWTLTATKLFLAILTITALRRRRLLTGSDMFRFLSLWLLSVACLYGILCWLIPPGLASWHVLIPCALIAVPMVRIALCPLMLAWNRHR